MNKQEKIKLLIEELILAEPDFSGKEKELEQILSRLLELQERIEIGEKFKRNLKAQLLDMRSGSEKGKFWSINYMNYMNKFSIGIAAVLLVVVGAAGTAVYVQRQSGLGGAGKVVQLFGEQSKITDAGKNAFGSLVGEGVAASGQGGGGSSTAAAPTTTSKEVGLGYGRGGGGGGGSASVMPPYYPYRFVYRGEKIELSETEGDVFKRIKNATEGSSVIAGILKTVSLGLIDINKFQNIKLQSFSLVEDKEFGYSVNVNAQDGSVNLYENWERWQTPDRQCADESCFERYRIRPEQMPKDDELIAIADKFMTDYGIARSNYGDPTIQKYWEGPTIQSERIALDIYLPDTVGVTYPLLVNGQVVYDEAGNPTGLSVNVNIRVKKVSGVYELYAQNYESSKYGLETNVERILKFAQNGGGYYGDIQTNGSEQYNELYLGTPTKALVRTWVYSKGVSQEFYVPALVFPVTGSSRPEQGYYQKFVTVPLVKEILDERAKNSLPGYPVPLGGPETMSSEPAQ